MAKFGVSDKVPVVRGEECLEYINRPIGFLNGDSHGTRQFYNNPDMRKNYRNPYWEKFAGSNGLRAGGINDIYSMLLRWYHDPNKRIIGYIRDMSDDGGLHVVLLGNETIKNGSQHSDIRDASTGDMFYLANTFNFYFAVPYTQDGISTLNWDLDDDFVLSSYLKYSDSGAYFDEYGQAISYWNGNDNVIPFDIAQDFRPNEYPEGDLSHGWASHYSSSDGLGSFWRWGGRITNPGDICQITDDPNNTVEFGVTYDTANDYGSWTRMVVCPQILIDYPTCLISGDMYEFMCNVITFNANNVLPAHIPSVLFDSFYAPFGDCIAVDKVNLGSIPFNLLLTSDYNSAISYINTGVLPFDAKLYPLDWDNLPTYDVPIIIPDPDDPTPSDNPDDIDPGDDSWDIDDDDDTDPTTSVKNLSNYNLYWLQADQWYDFINWFWTDISQWNGFEDLINSIEGLYNDLSSAVIMCRYMPIDISWVGGFGNDENIKLGMIEKNGAVNTISKNHMEQRVVVGEILINHKITKTFLDLSPYSQLSLYLPMHGFIDLDIDIFNGNTLRVEAIYDIIGGTLQYLIWVKHDGHKMLVNTIECKIAQDIPITLQTKNDRDSAVFNNVSSTVGGLIGAGVGIASGNPIGMTMGVKSGIDAISTGGSNSAPMRVMGTVGELGARFAPAYCKIVIRRPTIQPSDVAKEGDSNSTKLATWRKNVGQLCGYGYTLNKLQGYGFTICSEPRIDFTEGVPMQSEVDEIYDYLEKGVIL